MGVAVGTTISRLVVRRPKLIATIARAIIVPRIVEISVAQNSSAAPRGGRRMPQKRVGSAL